MTSTQALQLGVIACDELSTVWGDEVSEEMRQAAKVLRQIKQSITKPAELPNEPKSKRRRQPNKVSHWDKLTRPEVAQSY